jgi:hypothetical protein
MRILFLCGLDYVKTKLCRVRFQVPEFLALVSGIEVFWDGTGYDGWVDCLTSYNKYKPDVILWYKPFTLNGYDKLPNMPKILTYNETYMLEDTKKEILESKSNIIVLHHQNVVKDFTDLASRGLWVVNIPHCINPKVFKDYGHSKTIDILFAGVNSPQIYPLRDRWMHVLQSHRLSEYKIVVRDHPGYSIVNVDNQVRDFAEQINRAKIVVTCSSVFKYALTKYIEIPMCNSLCVADLPDERHDFFEQFIEPVTLDMTDDQLIDVLIKCLKDDKYRQDKCDVGMELCGKYRTFSNCYIPMLLKAIKDFAE